MIFPTAGSRRNTHIFNNNYVNYDEVKAQLFVGYFVAVIVVVVVFNVIKYFVIVVIVNVINNNFVMLLLVLSHPNSNSTSVGVT